jgi:hypothetical protein
MKFIFKIGPFHEVRVWLGELPEISYAEKPFADLLLKMSNKAPVEPRVAAIESRTIVGPRALYGLLCARCEPAISGDQGKLAVFAAKFSNPETISWALGSGSDPVTPGVCPEFGSAILQGASKAFGLHNVGAVDIQYFGAKAEMGSSADTFIRLSETLTRLVIARDWPPIDVEEFVRNALS